MRKGKKQALGNKSFSDPGMLGRAVSRMCVYIYHWQQEMNRHWEPGMCNHRFHSNRKESVIDSFGAKILGSHSQNNSCNYTSIQTESFSGGIAVMQGSVITTGTTAAGRTSEWEPISLGPSPYIPRIPDSEIHFLGSIAVMQGSVTQQ